MIAWGAKVSAAFRDKVGAIAAVLGGITTSDLMACMAWESGASFSPSIRNAAGSGAVGLIQFMPQTAATLGTSTEALAEMSAEEQLDYVRRYFWAYRGKLKNLGDLYMAILWPAGIGRPDSWVLFDRNDPDHPVRYVQNAGLDLDHNGQITRGEACARVKAKLAEGLLPANASA